MTLHKLSCLGLASILMIAACNSTQEPFEKLMPADAEKSANKTPAAATGSGNLIAPATVDVRMVNDATRRVFRMSNGFSVILEKNTTAPVAAVRIYVKAGALTEQKYMAAGLSHVLEHLVAGATSGKRKEEQNTLLLQQIGNDSNAYTDSDQTCYFITTSADKWPTALDLLVDFTTNTDFTKEQFDREFKVVQREIEMDEAEADRIFYQHTRETRYIDSPARHPVVGYKAAFQKLTYEDAKAYYQQMYVPDNMIISVAGDIDLEKAEQLIVDQLRNIRRRTVPAIALPSEPPVTVPRRSISHADVKQARVEWAFPTTDMYSPDLYATDTLASVLGGSESSALVRKLRDELQLVTGISCSNPTPSYAPGELEIDAELAPEKIPEAEKALMVVLDDVVKNGVPADAVDRAKAQAMAAMVFGNQTAEQQAIRNALDFMATGNIDYTEDYVRHIQTVTPEQVQAAAKKFIRQDSLLTTIVLPNSAKDPFAPSASNTQTVASTVRVQKTVLKNGLTLLISRNTAAPLASFHLYTLGGLLAENDQNNGVGAAMMDLLTRGTDTRTHEDIAKFIDATGTAYASESGSNSFLLSMDCLKDKAPDAFALFADMALHPKFDPKELQQVREPLIADVESATEDWWGEAYKQTKEYYYAASPYKRLPVGKKDVITNLTTDQIRAHYQNYFLDPQKMVLAISGDIDPAEAAKWAAPFEAIPQKSVSLNLQSDPGKPESHMLHTDKQSATIMLAYPPGMVLNSPDRHAAILLQTYLGGYESPGGSVLFEALRGKGLVYTVSASLIAGPAKGMFLISAQGEPQNVDPIVDNIQKLVEDLKKGNVSDTMLDAAKSQAITGEQMSKLTVSDKSGQEALDELLGLGYDDSEKFPAKIRAVTKADLIRVANTYLQKPTIVVMTPNAK